LKQRGEKSVSARSPDSPPDRIIGWVQGFIEAVTRRVEQIRAAGGTHKGQS